MKNCFTLSAIMKCQIYKFQNFIFKLWTNNVYEEGKERSNDHLIAFWWLRTRCSRSRRTRWLFPSTWLTPTRIRTSSSSGISVLARRGSAWPRGTNPVGLWRLGPARGGLGILMCGAKIGKYNTPSTHSTCNTTGYIRRQWDAEDAQNTCNTIE